MNQRQKTVIENARAKINAGWCQNNFAEKRTLEADYILMPDDPEATHYCLGGALRAASKNFKEYKLVHFLVLAAQPKGKKKFKELAEFNDSPGMTKQRVLNLLDRALAHASV